MCQFGFLLDIELAGRCVARRVFVNALVIWHLTFAFLSLQR